MHVATMAAKPTGEASVITVSWSGVKGTPLTYTKNGASQELCAGVDSLAFAYWKDDGTAALPVVAPSATDIWRVSLFLRLANGTQTVSAMTAAFVRSL